MKKPLIIVLSAAGLLFAAWFAIGEIWDRQLWKTCQDLKIFSEISELLFLDEYRTASISDKVSPDAVSSYSTVLNYHHHKIKIQAYCFASTEACQNWFGGANYHNNGNDNSDLRIENIAVFTPVTLRAYQDTCGFVIVGSYPAVIAFLQEWNANLQTPFVYKPLEFEW